MLINVKKIEAETNISLFNLSNVINIINTDQEIKDRIDVFYNKNKNILIDNDLLKFEPLNIDEIVFKLSNNDTQLYYNDFEFNQNDLNNYTDALTQFKFRMNFYTSNNISNRFLIYQINLFNQFNTYQRDINGDVFNDIHNLPVVFTIKKSNIELDNNLNNIGYYLFMPSENDFFSYPKKIFVEYQVLNSKNGSYVTFSPNLDINNIYGEYIFSKYMNNNYYTFNETILNVLLDGSKRIITLNRIL